MPHVATGHERHHGKVVGSGHCVPFVREVTGLPPTAQWWRGDPVRGGNFGPGVAIATFDPNGRYGNHVDGRSHAAILIAENSDGLLVVDCWVGRAVGQRLIRFRKGSGDPVNDGDAYYAIEVA